MVVNIGTWCPRMAAVMSLRFNVTFHPPRHALCREGHMLLRNPRAWLICEHTRIRGETPVIPRDLSDSASKLGSRIMISWFKSTCIMLPREDKGLRELLQSTWRLPHHFWILEVWWCTSLYHILHKYIYIYIYTYHTNTFRMLKPLSTIEAIVVYEIGLKVSFVLTLPGCQPATQRMQTFLWFRHWLALHVWEVSMTPTAPWKNRMISKGGCRDS